MYAIKDLDQKTQMLHAEGTNIINIKGSIWVKSITSQHSGSLHYTYKHTANHYPSHLCQVETRME